MIAVGFSLGLAGSVLYLGALGDRYGRKLLLLLGTSLSIPLGTSFHFRATGSTPFAAVCVTMPPWPGMDEAEFVVGPWQAG